VEVFGDAASLLFIKEPSHVEIYNDVDGHLVNLFKVVRDRCGEFQDRVLSLPYSRRLYKEFYSSQVTGDSLEDAVRFFYVLRSSFSGHMTTGWRTGTQKNEAREYFTAVERFDIVAARLRNVAVEDLDFRECIKRYDMPWTLFFCDPPYYGVNAYEHGFTEKDHVDLAEILRGVQGKWILTYNDHPRVRHLYAGFPLQVEKLPVMGASVKDGKRRRTWDQLIIANYELSSTPQFLKKHFFPERVKIPGTRPAFKSHGPKVRSS
jgi:DNA adenine methylase